jgi:uncharacterized protein (TIGR00251 family)
MIIELKVIPKSKLEQVDSVARKDQNTLVMKIRVKAPPEDGKANKAVIELISEYFAVKRDAVRILSGLTSRNKKVEIINPDLSRAGIQLSII